MVKHPKSFKEIEIRLSEIVYQIREIESKLTLHLSTGGRSGGRSALLKSRANLVGQLHSLSDCLKNYGEGKIVRVKFRTCSTEGVYSGIYQRYFINVSESEVPKLIQYKYGEGRYIEILEVQEILTSSSLEKL